MSLQSAPIFPYRFAYNQVNSEFMGLTGFLFEAGTLYCMRVCIHTDAATGYRLDNFSLLIGLSGGALNLLSVIPAQGDAWFSVTIDSEVTANQLSLYDSAIGLAPGAAGVAAFGVAMVGAMKDEGE